MYKNLETLMKELEQAIKTFHCWADDSSACDAAQEAASAFETGRVALKLGKDTEYAQRRILRALKMLNTYGA